MDQRIAAVTARSSPVTGPPGRPSGLASAPLRSLSPLDVEVAMGEPHTRQAEMTLTREEAQLLQLLGQGLSLDSVAQRLQTSQRTVRRRVKGICDRLGVGSSIQAVVWAVQRGLI